MQEFLLPVCVAVGIGLLVGIQRERTDRALAGVRTFPLIGMAGAIATLVAPHIGSPWLPAAGLFALAALVVTGSVLGVREGEAGVGITTEVAALVVYMVGAAAAAGLYPMAVVVGGITAALLHFKRPMHSLAERLSDDEMRAVMRIAVIGLVILPALPDETYGPYDVLNPFRIWLVVVLIVGISMAGYVAHRLVGARAGTLLGGVLGGFVSSTATTASYARRAEGRASFAPVAAAVAMVASTVVFARIFLEIAAVAPSLLPAIAAPLSAMVVFNVGLSAIGVARIRGWKGATTEHRDPSQLGAALVFGALYGVVLFAVAAAKEHMGDAGIYGVAALSGLTDVDAITISIARLADGGRIAAEIAWRPILLAALANLLFKGCMAVALGGRPMLRPVLWLFAPSLAAGAAILALWPEAA